MLLTNAVVVKYFCKQKLLLFVIFFTLVLLSNILFYSLNWRIFIDFNFNKNNNWNKLLIIILLTILFFFPFWFLFSFIKNSYKLKEIISKLNERDLYIYSKIKTKEVYKLISKARLQLKVFKTNKEDYIKFENLVNDWLKKIKDRLDAK